MIAGPSRRRPDSQTSSTTEYRNPNMPFIDEAVIVGSKYDDFLRHTLPFTMRHVKHIVVVTSDQAFDDPTRDLCRQLGIRCLSTGAMYRRGATFNKGAAINKGLDQLNQRGWVLHLDGDIALPDQTSTMLHKIDLDKDCIYGIDRVACPNGPTWKKFLDSGQQQYKWHCLVETPDYFPLMGRYIHEQDGYVPIGYFQLWHGETGRCAGGLGNRRYPEQGNEATHTDVQHALQWDGHKRRLLGEIIGIHLDSCSAPIGANWEGRKSPPFNVATVPSKAGVLSYYDKTKDLVNNPNHQSP
jgi:hypothetical protein